MHTMDELTRRLVASILRSNLSVKEIAEASDQRSSTIYRWMKGRSEPNAHGLEGLCRVLGVSADWLLGLSDQNAERKQEDDQQD